MGSGTGGLANTVRFLQEENQRLRELNEDLQEENAYLGEFFRSIQGLQRGMAALDPRAELRPLLDRIIYEALRLVDAADGSLSLIDEETQEIVFVVVRGVLQEKLEGHRMALGTGIVGWVATHRESAIANDIDQDERFSPDVDTRFHFRTRSVIAVPLISRGKILGVMEVVNKFSEVPFNETDREVLSAFSLIAAAVIDLAGAEVGE